MGGECSNPGLSSPKTGSPHYPTPSRLNEAWGSRASHTMPALWEPHCPSQGVREELYSPAGGNEEEGASPGFISPVGGELSSANWWPDRTGLVLHLWFFYLPPRPSVWVQTASKGQGYTEHMGLPCQRSHQSPHMP